MALLRRGRGVGAAAAAAEAVAQALICLNSRPIQAVAAAGGLVSWAHPRSSLRPPSHAGTAT